MQIAFYNGYKSKTLWDWIVCIISRSKYSHCELIQDNLSYSSSNRDGGVRFKRIK